MQTWCLEEFYPSTWCFIFYFGEKSFLYLETLQHFHCFATLRTPFNVIFFHRFFPKIFGKNEDLPLDLEGSWSAFKKLTEQVRQNTASHDLKHETLATVFE